MKDALGHGSEASGAHSSGVNQIGHPKPQQWTIGKAGDIASPWDLKVITAGMKPAIRMVRDYPVSGYTKGQVLVGERGQWHSEIADHNAVVPHDTDGHFGRGKDAPNYERGFVFPSTQTYYGARDIGVDASELGKHGGRS